MTDPAAWLLGSFSINTQEGEYAMRFRTVLFDSLAAAQQAAAWMEHHGFQVVLMALDDGELQVMLAGQRPSEEQL